MDKLKTGYRISDLINYEILPPYSENVLALIKAEGKAFEGEMEAQKTFIGIEVEVEGIQGPPAVNSIENTKFRYFWSAKEDPSLRNNGIEYVSIPISGNAIPLALSYLENQLCVGYPKHSFSDRTSVHVHLNCKHMFVSSFVNFMFLYLALEPVLYSFVARFGTSRKDSNYCVPVNTSATFYNLAKRMNELIAIQDQRTENVSMIFRHVVDDWRKYTGFNIQPLGRFGTVEFRQMSGTANAKLLKKWINLIFNLRLYAIKVSFEELKQQICMLNSNSEYEYFLKQVLKVAPHEVGVAENLQELLETSTANCKSIFMYPDLNKYKVKFSDFQQSPLCKVIQLEVDEEAQKALKAELVKIEAEKKLLSQKSSLGIVLSQQQLERYDWLTHRAYEISKSFGHVMDYFKLMENGGRYYA